MKRIFLLLLISIIADGPAYSMKLDFENAPYHQKKKHKRLKPHKHRHGHLKHAPKKQYKKSGKSTPLVIVALVSRSHES